jgi:hypothetical protein
MLETVMAGFVPAIHAALLSRTSKSSCGRNGVDARRKAGHDEIISI